MYKLLHCINLFIALVNSFVELTPKLPSEGGCEYVLSEVFNQDPIEIYFSRQQHRGGSNEDPSVQELFQNTATVINRKSVYAIKVVH